MSAPHPNKDSLWLSLPGAWVATWMRDVVGVDYQPVGIEFENNDLHSRKATLTAGTLAKIQTWRYQRREYKGSALTKETWYNPLTKLGSCHAGVHPRQRLQGP